jgi:PAS domain S-box-containing protein
MLARPAPSASAVRSSAGTRLGRLPFGAQLLLFAVGDFALVHLGREMTPGPTSFATFWPASGFMLGALLLSSRRRWGLLVAAAAVPIAAFNVLSGQPPLLVASFAVANVGEALLGAWLAQRLCGGRPDLTRLSHSIALVAAGPVIGSGVLSLLPAAALWRMGSPFVHPFLRMWLGSALGTVAVAPLLLAWAEPPRPSALTLGRAAEAGGLVLSFGTVACLVFVAPGGDDAFDAALFFPVLLWAVLRFGPRGATWSGVVLALVTLFATLRGRGAFAGRGSSEADALAAQLFCAVMLFSSLAVASVVESRRLGAEALRRSEQELRRIRFATDVASDLIACIEGTGAVVYVNDAFATAVGRAAGELVGVPIWSAGWVAAEEWAALWAEVKARGSHTAELLVKQPGGEALPLEVRSSYLSFDGQEYCVSAGRSLEERKRSEAALRMASVGTLAAGVAHEINNPLSYVLGNLRWVNDALAGARECLARPGGGDVAMRSLESVRPVLEEVTEGATRIRDIVRDLKLFSRPAEGASVADVQRALRAAVTLAQNEIRHRARLVLNVDAVPSVPGNEHKLGQVFLNLLVNAAQAIPEGQMDRNVIRVAVRPQGPGEIAIEVEDTGCGMAPEVRARAFEPFFTTKAVGAGTGLGLYVCHGIVGSMGGRFEVSSGSGAGSLFRVVLPACASSAAPSSSPAPADTPASSGSRRARVLVVDDDPLVGRMVERLLRDHDVVSCTQPASALDRAIGEEFDVILCDVMMPNMSAMEFHERLARERPRLADGIIFITGGAFTPAARAFIEMTSNTRLEKPIDTDLLRAEVARRTRLTT